MPSQPIDKFQAIEVLRDKPWTPIPKFFFRLWLHYSELPDSWWKSLFYILNVTLGSPSGVSGTLAYSELPVKAEQFALYKAALEGYGRLMDIETAEQDSIKGSTFTLRPDATEDDWITFHQWLYVAKRWGILTPRPGNRHEHVKAKFSKLAPRAAQENQVSMRMPCWSSIVLYTMAEQKAPFDIWNDANWKERGFDSLKLHHDTVPYGDVEEFNDLTGAEWFWLFLLFHFAWTTTTQHDHVPVIPAGEEPMEMIRQATGRAPADVEKDDERDGQHLANVLAKFRTVTFDDLEGEYLECEWLTKLWLEAKAECEVKKLAATTFQPLVDGMAKMRKKLISRPKPAS